MEPTVRLDGAQIAAVIAIVYTVVRGGEAVIKYLVDRAKEQREPSRPTYIDNGNGTRISADTLKLVEAVGEVRQAVELHDATETQRLATLAATQERHADATARVLDKVADALTKVSTLLETRECVAKPKPRRKATGVK